MVKYDERRDVYTIDDLSNTPVAVIHEVVSYNLRTYLATYQVFNIDEQAEG